MTMNGLVSVELSYGIVTLPFQDQKSMLEESLQAVKHVIDGMPHELTIDLNTGMGISQSPPHGLPDLLSVGHPTSVFDDSHSAMHYCPIPYATVQPTSDFRHTSNSHTTGSHPPERRRLLQYEIQKANIYASQLATRSYYVERYLNLRDAHREHARAQAAAESSFAQSNLDPSATPSENNKSVAAAALHVAENSHNTDPVDAAMTAERELIVQHLLTVLTSISQRSMEPNGASMINKIRQVASTLVNDAPERKGPLAVKAQESLSRFVEILMRLERIPPGTGVGFGGGDGGVGVGEDEEVELRNWADLRETQVRFLQGGGFMGLL